MARCGGGCDVVTRLVANHDVTLHIVVATVGNHLIPLSALGVVCGVRVTVLLIIEGARTCCACLKLIRVVAIEGLVASHIHSHLLGIVVIGSLAAMCLQVLINKVVIIRLHEVIARILTHLSSRIRLVGALGVQSVERKPQACCAKVCRHAEVHLTISANGEVVGKVLILQCLLTRGLCARNVHLIDVRVERLELHLEAHKCLLPFLQTLDLQFDGVVVDLRQQEFALRMVSVHLCLMRYTLTGLVKQLDGKSCGCSRRRISVDNHRIVLRIFIIHRIA